MRAAGGRLVDGCIQRGSSAPLPPPPTCRLQGPHRARQHAVVRREGPRALRQERPRAEGRREPVGDVRLEDGEDEEQRGDAGGRRTQRREDDRPRRHADAQQRRRRQQERPDEVDAGEPPIARRRRRQPARQRQRQPHAAHRVEEGDRGEVEREVAQRHLDGGRPAGRRRRQQAGAGRTDVGAERQRVDALERDDAGAGERRQRRREDGAALEQGGADGAGRHRDVAGERRRDARQVGVDAATHDGGDGTAKHDVEQTDEQDEAAAQEDERDGEQDKAHRRVGQTPAAQHEPACRQKIIFFLNKMIFEFLYR